MAEALYRYGIKITPKGNHNLQFRKPKLEIGTVATDWSPAPEDPDKDAMELISILQTDFSVVQGEIQAKVWETDIQKATEGVYESITELYSYIDETINKITAEVGNLTYVVDENYSSLISQISDLVLTDSNITAMVQDVEQTMIGNYTEVTEMIASLQIEADGITSTVRDLEKAFSNMSEASNILLHTEDLDMIMPWRGYNEEEAQVQVWYVRSDDSLPAGSHYVWMMNSSGYTSGSYRVGSFHWFVTDNIIADNVNKLVEGETYTFSCYVKPDTDELYRIWINRCLYGQTVLDSNLEIHTDGPSSVYFGKDYVEIPAGNIDTWTRISITFRLDDLDNFRIGLSFGSESSSTPYIYICGLMLNEGSVLPTWDNGTTETFATTELVYSQIEQLAGSIKLSVTSTSNGSASIVLSANGEEAGSGDVLANGVRYAFRNDNSAITISAGTITFNSDTFICNATYFKVAADGTITARAGEIGGWTIATSGLYKDLTSFTDTTAGIYLGTSGLRCNSSSIGVAISSGHLTFYDSNNNEMGGIYSYYNDNTVGGIWIGKTRLRTHICGDVWTEQGKNYGSTVQTLSGYMEIYDRSGNLLGSLTFSNGMLTAYSSLTGSITFKNWEA